MKKLLLVAALCSVSTFAHSRLLTSCMLKMDLEHQIKSQQNMIDFSINKSASEPEQYRRDHYKRMTTDGSEILRRLMLDLPRLEKECSTDQAKEDERERVAKAKKEADDAARKISDDQYKERMAAIQAERERRAKMPGARIGMTRKQVVDNTSWGPPEKINETISTYGTREQWVYDGNEYLYFTNGRLTGIQTSR